MAAAYYLLILLNTALLVCGQLLWKSGLQQQPAAFASLRSITALLLSPYILGGLFIYALATVLWLYILSKAPLSIAYPTQSLAYIATIFAAYFLYGEPLSLLKLGGALLILAGVSLIGLSAARLA